MNKKKTKNLVLLSLFIAIEVVMSNVPFLGFIPVGALRATTLHIPVIIAGIVIGKNQGAFIGLVFGLCSLFTNTITPTVSSFIFSPFISGSFFSLIIVLVPRILIGYVSGLIYEIMKKKNETLGIISGSFIGGLTNTILVLLGIYLIFANQYAAMLNMDADALLPYILGIVSTQGLLEAILGTIISFMASKVLLKLYK